MTCKCTNPCMRVAVSMWCRCQIFVSEVGGAHPSVDTVAGLRRVEQIMEEMEQSGRSMTF